MKNSKKWIALVIAGIILLAAVFIFQLNKSDEKADSVTQVNSGEEANDTKETLLEETETAAEDTSESKNKDITIIYTNDIHSYIYNTRTNDDGTTEELLTYASIAALKKELEAKGQTVFLVDDGDNIQGNAYGGLDKGASVVQLMAAAGYDLSSVGNHEFDYGMDRALEVFKNSPYPYISCNFSSTETGESILPAYKILEKNGVKVAFIGISTPETITKSSPIYFQNDEGKTIYDFKQSDDGQKFYECVQQAIDEVKDQADYVIALGHLGNEEDSVPYRSSDVIQNTRGLDAFIDGHSHRIIESESIKDLDGKDVVMTQSGYYLKTIGLMNISAGTVKTSLISDYDKKDPNVDLATQKITKKVNDELGVVIAKVDNPLFMNDAMDVEKRLIRKRETNLGDFVADSVYWYFNMEKDQQCDIALVNGGGIRSDVKVGDFTYLSAKGIQPFGNVICLVEVSGQDIKDMLEWSYRLVGETESGGFLHLAGAKYGINTAIECTAAGDDNDEFISGPTGEYRVSDIQIYNRATGEYDDLDTEKMYKVAGINYLLRNGGNGFTMLTDASLIVDYVNEDYLVCAEYAKAFKEGDDGMPHINNAGSPLNEYSGYLFDYENPMGAGRINIYSDELK